MNIIGEKFKNNEVFVPEILVAARAMNKGMQTLKPALTREGIEPIGKAVICTVKGDIHDIGKNLVKIMIERQGIECIDLGVDVDPARVVETIRDNDVQIVCLSALLTTTMYGQKDVIDALREAGLRDKVKVMVGGAPGIKISYYPPAATFRLLLHGTTFAPSLLPVRTFMPITENAL